MRLGLALALILTLVSPAAAQKRLSPVEPPPAPLADYEAKLRLVLGEAYAPQVILRAVVRPSFQVEYAVGLRRTPEGHEMFALWPSRQVWTYEAIALMKSGRMGSFTVDGLLDDPPMDPERGRSADARDKGGKRGGKRDRDRDQAGERATADALEDLADALEEDTPEGPAIRDTTDTEIARLQQGLPENPADLPLTRCAVAVDEAVAAALIGAWRRMLSDIGPDAWQAGLDGSDYRFALESGGRTIEGAAWSPRPKTRPARLAELAEAMRAHCEKPDPARLARIAALARRLGGAKPR